MQIGDKVLVRGTIDEIRKDVVIIKNEGGYFGTVTGEILANEVCQDHEAMPTMWQDVDKEEAAKSVIILDLFSKVFCRYKNDYERFDDLKFRCNECPFQHEDRCSVKEFKIKYAPNYRDFGAMGDL
ncbi:MAG: hypothetical protein J6U56_05440 [Spirochaetia bacterium]|nr:hypothetical protein [Spirochaetia bacterium]